MRKNVQPKPRLTQAIIIASVLVFGAGLIIVRHLRSPERSVSAYCAEYKLQDTELSKAQGSTYSVSVFSHKSSNPGDFVLALSKLERVAPDEIRPDIKALHQAFEGIKSNPSQTLGISLSALPAESNVKNWTSTHCGD